MRTESIKHDGGMNQIRQENSIEGESDLSCIAPCSIGNSPLELGAPPKI